MYYYVYKDIKKSFATATEVNAWLRTQNGFRQITNDSGEKVAWIHSKFGEESKFLPEETAPTASVAETAPVAPAVAAPMMGEKNFKSMREEIFAQDEDDITPIEEPEAIEPLIETEEENMDNRAYLAETLRRVAKEVEAMPLTATTTAPAAQTIVKTIDNPKTLKDLEAARTEIKDLKTRATNKINALESEKKSLAEQLAAAQTRIDELTKELTTAKKTAATWQSKATKAVASAPETVATPAADPAPAPVATADEDNDCPWGDHWDHDDHSPAPETAAAPAVETPVAVEDKTPAASNNSAFGALHVGEEATSEFRAFDALNSDEKLVSFKPITICNRARVIKYGMTESGVEYYVFEDAREEPTAKTRIVFKSNPSFEDIRSGLKDKRFEVEWFNNEIYYREFALDWMQSLERDEWLANHTEMQRKMRELWFGYAHRAKDIESMTDEELLDVDFEHEKNQLEADCIEIGTALCCWQHIILDYRMGGCENVTIPIVSQAVDMDWNPIGKPMTNNYSCSTIHNKINQSESTRLSWANHGAYGVSSLFSVLEKLRKRFDTDPEFAMAYMAHEEEVRDAEFDAKYFD